MKLTPTAATPYTGYIVPRKSTLLAAAADESTMAEQLPPQQPSHDNKHHAQEMLHCYIQDFEETAQSEQHCHSDADSEGFICGELNIINECSPQLNMPEDGH